MKKMNTRYKVISLVLIFSFICTNTNSVYSLDIRSTLRPPMATQGEVRDSNEKGADTLDLIAERLLDTLRVETDRRDTARQAILRILINAQNRVISKGGAVNELVSLPYARIHGLAEFTASNIIDTVTSYVSRAVQIENRHLASGHTVRSAADHKRLMSVNEAVAYLTSRGEGDSRWVTITDVLRVILACYREFGHFDTTQRGFKDTYLSNSAVSYQAIRTIFRSLELAGIIVDTGRIRGYSGSKGPPIQWKLNRRLERLITQDPTVEIELLNTPWETTRNAGERAIEYAERILKRPIRRATPAIAAYKVDELESLVASGKIAEIDMKRLIESVKSRDSKTRSLAESLLERLGKIALGGIKELMGEEAGVIRTAL